MIERPTVRVLEADDVLYRRVHWSQVTEDAQDPTGWRVKSSDWLDAEGQPSVYSGRLLGEFGIDPGALLKERFAGFALVTITLEKLRLLGEGAALDVEHSPDDADFDRRRGDAHCVVINVPETNNAKRRVQTQLARVSVVIEPPVVR